jgi:acyl dehydratase
MTRPYTGRWFEELRPGLVIQHAIRRTITEADNVTFTTMTMNPAWLHLDFDYAANETEFGRPLVNTGTRCASRPRSWRRVPRNPDRGRGLRHSSIAPTTSTTSSPAAPCAMP